MRDPIVRMYETEAQAREAVQKLKDEGFTEDSVFLVTPRSGGEAGSPDAIAAAIMAGFVLRSHAKVYARDIQRGRSLVVVRAPFGYGQLATDLMASCGPVDTGLRLPQEPSIAWDEAAPISSAFALPVLWRRQPAPFSAFLGLSPLARGRSFLSPMFGELGSSKFSLSSVFGLGLLSRNGAPLSSLLGLKTRSGKTGAKTGSFGLPLLVRNPAPFSSLFGLPLLARHR
jgi:hypothetical protein